MRIFIMAFFLLMLAQSSFAARIVSMEEAERIFFDNSLEVRLLKADLQKAEAGIIEARTLSNPALKYSLESLKNGERDTEETWSLSRSFDFAGKRGRRVEAAKKNRESRGFFTEHEIAGRLARMKQAYWTILLLREKEKALDEIVAVYSEVEGKTSARVEAGDAAEADLMRLASEKQRVLRELNALRTELGAGKKRLALLLNFGVDEFELPEGLEYSPVTLSLPELLDKAQSNRRDIRGQGIAVEASGASLALARREALPTVDLEAGYKSRTGGFSGIVFGVTVPLPVFDRNQGGIARADAGLEQERLTLELMKKAAESEVSILYDRISSLQARIGALSLQLGPSRELTQIATISYEEGEAGLLDLLDAVRSEKELALEYHGAIYEHRAAVFDLEMATGTKLIQTGGAQ